MTTRRDYELMHSAIRAAVMSTPDTAEKSGIAKAARELAYALKKRNPMFDELRFLRDCGVTTPTSESRTTG